MNVPAHETVGLRLPVWQTTVDESRQARYHEAAGIDTALFGDRIDVSVLANDCLHGARPREALGAKRLHVGVRVHQTGPLILGEELTVAASVDSLRPDRRGRYIRIKFEFRRADGNVPVTIDHQSLILDAAPQEPTESSGKMRAAPADTRDFERIGSVQLTPKMVSGYSFEFPHLAAHHDVDAAAAIGMRAPIAQGLMGFTLLHQEFVRSGYASAFDIEARFKRPIFWDDLLQLERAGDHTLRAVNLAGKTTTELMIHD